MARIRLDAILPKVPQNPTLNFLKAMRRGIVKTLDEGARKLAQPARTWSHQPVLEEHVPPAASIAEGAEVFTTDINYGRVNDGTPAHIVGAGGRRMRIRPSSPKTMPGSLKARGGSVGESFWRTGPWRVRGITPRLFDKQAAEWIAPRMAVWVQRELDLIADQDWGT